MAPATLGACRDIASAVARVDSSIPLTLLVVPRYHGANDEVPEVFRTWIEERLARGDEIALHGYTHRDDNAGRVTPLERLRRNVYTAQEGEFSALTREAAAARIAAGRQWLSEQGWTADGFVAPAWLLSEGAWEAVKAAGFVYTTTLSRFHVLKSGRSMSAPTLVYSTRAPWRRALSRIWNSALAAGTQRAQLVRFGFHPADAQHETVMEHALRMLGSVAQDRTALTKSAFARSLR